MTLLFACSSQQSHMIGSCSSINTTCLDTLLPYHSLCDLCLLLNAILLLNCFILVLLAQIFIIKLVLVLVLSPKFALSTVLRSPSLWWPPSQAHICRYSIC